ncbi:MAG: hypothetical protein MJ192_00180 [Clostridia bacterium]|nr:hypothetical protein [Clostridia bacterium]
MALKNGKGFRLFDQNRDGPGVEKGEDTTPNIKYFFKLWGRKFWKLISLNLVMLVQIIPLLICLYVYLAGPKTAAQYYPLSLPLIGAQTAQPTSVGMTLLTMFSGLYHIPAYNTYAWWVIGILAAFHVITYGWQMCGCTYILRNLVRGDGVFILSDFFYAIKKNLKQGFFMGLIDCAVVFALVFDFLYFLSAPATGWNNFMYVLIIALFIIWMFMRFYLYLMLVTFDMKIGKILKNALIFTALGVKRNLMGALGIVLMALLSAALIVLCVSIRIYAVIILPFMFFLAFAGFMYTYAAWPVVKKYMIDPVQSK